MPQRTRTVNSRVDEINVHVWFGIQIINICVDAGMIGAYADDVFDLPSGVIDAWINPNIVRLQGSNDVSYLFPGLRELLERGTPRSARRR
jgi:hypothetical protein